MVKKIEYTTIHGISIRVNFYDYVTIIGGDSSTGKSFIKNTIQEYYNDVDKYIVEIFDYKRPVTIDILRVLKGKLIIIDNGDILLDGNNAIAKHINSDKQNQYLLFMRSENGIDVSVENYAELRQDGNKLFAVYENR